MFSIEDIKKVSFRRAGFGGYKPEDVDSFVDNIQISYEEMMREKQNLLLTIQKLETEIEKFRDEEKSIKEVILNLKNITEKSLSDAESKAKDVVSRASETSEKMIATAKKEVDVQKEISDKLKKESIKLRKHLEDIYLKHMEIIREISQDDFDEKSVDESDILQVAAGNSSEDIGSKCDIEEAAHPYNEIFKK